MDKKRLIALYIFVGLIILIVLSGAYYYRYFINGSFGSNFNFQNLINNYPSINKQVYTAIYQDKDSIYGIDKKGNKIKLLGGKKLFDSEELTTVSSDGTYIFTYVDNQKTSYLRTINGDVLKQFQGYVGPESWFGSNNALLNRSTAANINSPVNYDLWDLQNLKMLKTVQGRYNGKPKILYNGNILIKNVLDNPLAEDNTELLIYENNSSTPQSIGKFRLGSESSESTLSNDKKKLAISGKGTIFIYDFESLSSKQGNERFGLFNYYNPGNFDTWYMKWSPDDNYIAFKIPGENSIDKIGIVNLNSKQIDYIDFVTIINTVNKPRVFLNLMGPVYWKDNDNVYIKVEGEHNEFNGKEFNLIKTNEYIEYNLKTKNLKVLSKYSGIEKLFFIN